MAVAWQVRGDFDDPIYLPGVVESLPETKVVSVGSFKLGVCHGHQIVPWGDAESLGAPHLPPRAEPRYRMSATLLPPASPPLGCASPAAHAAATHTHAHAHTHTRVRTCTHVRAGAMQRQLDCDILVSGHTHRFSAYESGARTTTARPPMPAHQCQKKIRNIGG